ncbi:MAG TPA: xanthine dehydrogenase family protein molybdopterin-binding subunit [Syntrophorhabdaceae bacterium]|nr:xanthine dehydrogenase family protein molybdopterin-binding subunit [Syntrophorhabdaceae bacterium]HQM82358.1 xanthine dehydrogenase family protein molybdopterin-binding subunit [Syntrophorhabdaceae bacterium]
MKEYTVIGQRVPRIDGKAKVMGQAKYAADYSLPGMLFSKVARLPVAHAKILNVDTSKAERLPGVKAVVTAKDFNGWTWGFMANTRDEPPLAMDKVRYYMEAVAGVAAIDEDIAEEACDLIKVDYEELPSVFDPEEAIQEGAPVIHNYRPNNVSVEYHWNFGDVEKAFAESHLVREDRFRTSRATKGYLEPPASLAWYDPAGYITVWAAKQSPYFHYRHLAACFNLPLSKIRVIQPYIGGGFGGTKNDSVAGDFCAVMLSKMTGKPVKFVYTQEEELTVSKRRHSMIVYNKMGMSKDGLITAIQSRVIADGGGYTAVSPLTMYLTGCCTPLPYKLPNYKYDCYRAFTNNPICAAMRGHGVTHTRFACEIQMEMMAEELGIDPVEIRMRNAIDNPKPGEIYRTINDMTLKTCGIKEAIQTLVKDPLWAEKGKGPKQDGSVSYGVGMAATSYLGGARQLGHQSCAATVRICEDGTVNLITGATDCGQGSDTVLAMIAAEELGVRYQDIDFKMVDSAYTPVDAGSYGSRVTVLAGQAVQIAAADAKKQLLAILGSEWKVNPEELEIKNAEVYNKSNPTRRIPFERLAKIACYSGSGAVIIGKGYSGYGIEPLDFENGRGNSGTSFSFTAQTTRAGVDLETGHVTVSDFVIAHDCGRPLNPIGAESQNEGGAVQGMGQAIYEDFIMDSGRTLNSTFLDYKMPRSTDVPDIKVIDIITDDPSGPFGAKEASEGSHVSAPPSVVAAIHDATGIWFKEQPVTPEKIVKGLKEKGKWPGK